MFSSLGVRKVVVMGSRDIPDVLLGKKLIAKKQLGQKDTEELSNAIKERPELQNLVVLVDLVQNARKGNLTKSQKDIVVRKGKVYLVKELAEPSAKDLVVKQPNVELPPIRNQQVGNL